MNKAHRTQQLSLLLGWPCFLILFFLSEKYISAEQCHTMHCALDDLIPFCEAFVIPYVLWYGLIVFSLAYFFIQHPDSFKKLQIYIIIIQALAMIIYVSFPSKQLLRPTSFPRDNFLSQLVALIYRLDTNTGVCPSLHCAISIAIASVWLKEKGAPKHLKAAVCILCVLICMSTVFIKQHSCLDLAAALPLCMLAEYLVFRCRRDKFMLSQFLSSAKIKKASKERRSA